MSNTTIEILQNVSKTSKTFTKFSNFKLRFVGLSCKRNFLASLDKEGRSSAFIRIDACVEKKQLCKI